MSDVDYLDAESVGPNPVGGVAEASATWMDRDDEPNEGLQVSEYDITSAPNDFNVSTLISFLDSGAIVLPPYQRNYTWDKARASKLIESLLLGLPVPQLFLYEESRNKFAILDGQQRLMSLYFFVKGRFPRKEKRMFLREIFEERGIFPQSVLADDALFSPFNLSLPARGGEPASKFHGMNYQTLGDHLTSFQLRTMRCLIIKQNEPKNDNSSVFEIFDRLNTGGVSLKPQEIRANLYYSDFYKSLYELNKDVRWRSLLGQKERDTNLRDVELILRAIAMLVSSDSYRPSMTRFLNTFSSEAKRNMSAADIVVLKAIFENMLAALDHVNPQLLRLNDRFSIGVFEALLYAAARDAWAARSVQPLPPVSDAQAEAVLESIRPRFKEGTSKTENVKGRLRDAAARFREVA
jgi:hypothetical protein